MNLFDTPHFDGRTYEPEHDRPRLNTQLTSVLDLMRDGQWRTLAEIQQHVKGSEAGISARLRDLRKEKFGGHDVQHRRRGQASQGLFEYRVIERVA